MKKLYLSVVLLIFGLATPLVATAITPMVAVAQTPSLSGTFGDKQWTISIYRQNNIYRYQGYNIQTKKSIDLAGATLSGDHHRRIYTWNNQGTKYQASWQTKDPDYIRIRVILPNGKEIFNRLIPRSVEYGC